MNLGITVATGAVRGGTSILFAALGETVSERAGVVNLGVEGSMLCGALAAYAVAAETGNLWVGLLAGGIAGALLRPSTRSSCCPAAPTSSRPVSS